MEIWVDADACPVVIREILFRAAERTGVAMTLVANKPVRLPAVAQNIHFAHVPAGFDAAIEKGGVALNPRGELYTSENVRERLSVRNFLDELRGSGVNTGGPPALSQRERQMFANQLDRLLARRAKAGDHQRTV